MEKYRTKRWLVVLGTVLLQICLGSIYSWSLFNQPLVEQFGWEKSSVVLTFSITIVMFGFSTIFAGKWQEKIGPKKVAIFGGILLGLGLILSSRATSLIELYIYYGVIGGAGVGITYVCPLTTCIKWFPEKRGFITGVAVGSFGLGSLIFKSIALRFIVTSGISKTFLYLGIINMIVIVLGSQLLMVPPAEDKIKFTKQEKSNDNNFTIREMMNTKVFYLLWMIYFFGCISGLLIIGLAKDIGIELVKLSPEVAARAVTIIALFNASGRLIWGIMSDKIGRIRSFQIIYITTCIGMVVMSIIPMNMIIFYICIAMVAFSFGGIVTVVPAITADYFGVKNLGSNYGIIFQAFGISAIVGPFIAGQFGLQTSFLIAAALSIICIITTFFIKPPSYSMG